MLEAPAVTQLCMFPPCHAVVLRSCRQCICRRNDVEYYRMTEPVRTRNEVLMAAAQQQYDVAVQQWQKEYSLAVMEWESLQVCANAPMLHACHCNPLALGCLHKPSANLFESILSVFLLCCFPACHTVASSTLCPVFFAMSKRRSWGCVLYTRHVSCTRYRL